MVMAYATCIAYKETYLALKFSELVVAAASKVDHE